MRQEKKFPGGKKNKIHLRLIGKEDYCSLHYTCLLKNEKDPTAKNGNPIVFVVGKVAKIHVHTCKCHAKLHILRNEGFTSLNAPGTPN